MEILQQLRVHASLWQLIALGSSHQSNFLCTLHNLRAALLAQKSTVLEEALVARKPVGQVAECDKAETPDATAAKLTLELHAIGAPENAVTVEPALHELALVPWAG